PEVEVLQVPDPAPRLHLGVARNGIAFLLAGGVRVVAPGIPAHQRDLALRQVLACADAEARLACAELLARLGLALGRERLPGGVRPQVAVARVEEDAVARADLPEPLPLEHALHVRGGDDPGALRVPGNRQTLHAPVRRRIQHDAAADERVLGNVLHAAVTQPYDPPARSALVDFVAPP